MNYPMFNMCQLTTLAWAWRNHGNRHGMAQLFVASLFSVNKDRLGNHRLFGAKNIIFILNNAF